MSELSRRREVVCGAEANGVLDGMPHYCNREPGHDGAHAFKPFSKALDHSVPSDDEAAQQYAGSLGANVSEIERVFTGYQPKDTHAKMRGAPNAGSSVKIPYPQSPNAWNRPLFNTGSVPVHSELSMQHNGATPDITTPQGGRQSPLNYRYDLLVPKAIATLAALRYEAVNVKGRAADNWTRIPLEDHLNHAMGHIVNWLDGDRTEDHLGHAFCRLMFAVGVEEGEKPATDTQAAPDITNTAYVVMSRSGMFGQLVLGVHGSPEEAFKTIDREVNNRGGWRMETTRWENVKIDTTVKGCQQYWRRMASDGTEYTVREYVISATQPNTEGENP